MANMVLITKGTNGDLIPFVGIGTALKARGHNVILLTHCHYADLVRQAGLDFMALDTPEEFERFVEDGVLLNNPHDLPFFFRRHLLPKALLEYEAIEELCRSRNSILITRHMSSIAALIAAETLRLPIVRVFIAPSQIATLPLLEKLCENILAADINGIRAEIGLPPVRNWHAWLSYPQRSIAPWPDWFVTPSLSLPPEAVPVGFIMHNETETGDIPKEVQEILDNNKPPILITSGTGVFLGARFYAVSAEACRLLGRPGIMVTRYQKLVPKYLPTGVTWLKYLPFANLMPHVAAVIHHGGTSTLARAMAAGVPQLALAVGGDRPDTASHLQRLGVAEYLPPPHWEANIVAEALYRLTSSPIVQERCRDLSRRLQDTDPATAACEVIEELMPSQHTPEGSTLADQALQGLPPILTREPASKANDSSRLLDDLSPERRALLALRLRTKS